MPTEATPPELKEVLVCGRRRFPPEARDPCLYAPRFFRLSREGTYSMDAALVIHYKRPFVGRESLAMESFQDAMTFFGKQAADGHCEPPAAYMGVDGGMMIIHGERMALFELIGGEDFHRVFAKAEFATDGLRHELMFTGDRLATETEVGVELGLMEVPG